MMNLPKIGDRIKVRALNGEVIEGVVNGHDLKDGRSIVDYEGRRLMANGCVSNVTQMWAWPDQIVQLG